ncbi:type I methionyl aminopeptidase [Cellulomonas sp. zg-ZUI222]|uniref:Methionine aminopeptidase n=1 Tax=Cellulomonas wangleii TaxID=2816956 RepID=A0ABX8D5T0_9CELL|nr:MULTISPECIES: type I methionyl aminopeptidase [Cellulomonas]MBO0898546.1 type I methionyl aminopeptidase [Cellulomonas sp. zg-ZUI22]MBO0919410.1 type I methionyl aminopeptidase [Cellulomonas wangleii]MBO0924452.1 type I methionyl aminopeptidase [Cellulomonas wangleii]QVI62446.1 type I methionyl aminopeptidase [Cellulomonas wangleii]
MALKSPAEIEQMRPAGRFVADVLTSLREFARVGMTTNDLDAHARELIAKAGAHSVYLGYHPSFGAMPYPGVLCTSVNADALHGLPSERVLQDGDVLSIDFACQVEGWVADSALTFQLGTQTPEAQRLIAATEQALAAGIAAAQPNARMGDVSAAIGRIARQGGYGLNTDFGGHGVGRTMHEDPHVPNDGRPGSGGRLKPGLVIAIEPWFMAGGNDYVVDDDGWTIRTADGSLAAHAEHTVAITKRGPVVLTARD